MATTTRELVASSWKSAERVAQRDGAIVLNAASMAGWCLQNADGDAERAIAKVPEGNGYWDRVKGYLEAVSAEERQSRGPRLQAGA